MSVVNVIVLRLRAARDRAGADGQLVIRHRAMLLDVMLDAPLPRRVVDAEIPLCALLTPSFAGSLWQGRAEEYPLTGLPALEAVQAAAQQPAAAAKELDLALRGVLLEVAVHRPPPRDPGRTRPLPIR